jgi:lipopolysaccharide export system permease protein
MKKIDKLIIKAFIGPFILTFAVVVFILLTVQMMNYVDQIFGKDLSYVDLGILVMHFAIFQTPIAFPLSVMLASLMTFGNLGEHFELTAIKSAGISLIRAMQPIFIMVLFVTVIAFFSNNYLVPNSALKAYSLLYDIRQKKPALDIEPGLFYGGIEKYKIKVNDKLPDGKTLLDIVIYNHTERNGNRDVIIADSGLMYTIMDDQYLKFELYSGSHYKEGKSKPSRGRARDYKIINPFSRTFFEKSEIIFDLSSFGMSRTDEGLFASNRLMRNFNELNQDLDSLSDDIYLTKAQVYEVPKRFFTYSSLKEKIKMPEDIVEVQLREDSLKRARIEERKLKEDSVKTVKYDSVSSLAKNIKKDFTKSKTRAKFGEAQKIKKQTPVKVPENFNPKKQTLKKENKKKQPISMKTKRLERVLTDSAIIAKVDLKYEIKNFRLRTLKGALATTRQAKSKLSVQNSRIEQLNKSYFEFDIQWHKMLATAAACLSMFLIGAPLGAIIKRGGLGFPVLVSILFFIIYYVISIGGEKYAKSGLLPVMQGVWMANIILLPIGIFFLRQAKNDARLFEVDYYLVTLNKYFQWIKHRLDKKD